ncbi:hypothetical protein D3C74_465700 [compost metagenome]
MQKQPDVHEARQRAAETMLAYDLPSNNANIGANQVGDWLLANERFQRDDAGVWRVSSACVFEALNALGA